MQAALIFFYNNGEVQPVSYSEIWTFKSKLAARGRYAGRRGGGAIRTVEWAFDRVRNLSHLPCVCENIQPRNRFLRRKERHNHYHARFASSHGHQRENISQLYYSVDSVVSAALITSSGRKIKRGNPLWHYPFQTWIKLPVLKKYLFVFLGPFPVPFSPFKLKI